MDKNLVMVGTNIMEMSMRVTLKEESIMDMVNTTMLILEESMRANLLITKLMERV